MRFVWRVRKLPKSGAKGIARVFCGALLDQLLKARMEAGLTQAQVAERMGTQAPAVARLERALATGKRSPSLTTLRKYVQACGKRLQLRVV